MLLPEWQAMPEWHGAVKMAVGCHSGRKHFLAESISAHYLTITYYPFLAHRARSFT
jgi:hypothetical protein